MQMHIACAVIHSSIKNELAKATSKKTIWRYFFLKSDSMKKYIQIRTIAIYLYKKNCILNLQLFTQWRWYVILLKIIYKTKENVWCMLSHKLKIWLYGYGISLMSMAIMHRYAFVNRFIDTLHFMHTFNTMQTV